MCILAEDERRGGEEREKERERERGGKGREEREGKKEGKGKEERKGRRGAGEISREEGKERGEGNITSNLFKRLNWLTYHFLCKLL